MLYDADLPDHWILKRAFCNPLAVSESDAVNWTRAAAFFGAKESTVKRWYQKSELPYMARKLCLVKIGGALSLHGKQWKGFCVVDEVLHTPIKGYSLTANQVAATWYLVNNMPDKPRQWWQLAARDF
ncbi:hypothetical protein LG288_05955 [Idiomarina seosinensis]|uniref:hypothetical protein n=1 Tax=Idiomarina seosinensis TaxID=281739 RepID=UPI00384E567B